MTCVEARTLMLEAERDALKGLGADPLAAHLRSCPRCQAAAAGILAAHDTLAAYLTTPAERTGVDAVLDRLAPPTRPRSRWSRSAWGSLALAAAAVGVVFLTRAPGPSPDLGTLAAAPVPTPPLVEAAGANTVAVLETDNPDVTVLWFF